MQITDDEYDLFVTLLEWRISELELVEPKDANEKALLRGYRQDLRWLQMRKMLRDFLDWVHRER